MRENEIGLLNFINKNKYLNVAQISEYLEVSEKRAYAVLGALVDQNYLGRKNIVANAKGVYFITRKAYQSYGLEFSPVNKISLSNYEHNMFSADVAVKFAKKQGNYITERELRKRYAPTFTSVSKDRNIYPDAMYITPENQKIAIECELTKKSKLNVMQKFNALLKSSKMIDFDVVFYFFRNQSIFDNYSNVIREAGFSEFIQCYMYDEL